MSEFWDKKPKDKPKEEKKPSLSPEEKKIKELAIENSELKGRLEFTQSESKRISELQTKNFDLETDKKKLADYITILKIKKDSEIQTLQKDKADLQIANNALIGESKAKDNTILQLKSELDNRPTLTETKIETVTEFKTQRVPVSSWLTFKEDVIENKRKLISVMCLVVLLLAFFYSFSTIQHFIWEIHLP